MKKFSKAGNERKSELSHLKEQLQQQIELTQLAQAQVRQLAEELERRVAERIAIVEKANPRLRQRIARKKRYIRENRTICACEVELQNITAGKKAQEEQKDRNQVEDIGDRRHAQEALRIAQERLEFLVAASPVAIYSCKPDGDYQCNFISQNVTLLLGYDNQQFIEEKNFWLDRIHPEDKPQILANLSQLLEKEYQIQEYRFLHKNGKYRWMRDEMKLLRDEAGNPAEIIGYWLDISDSKQVEKAWRDSERRLQTIVANLFESEARLHTIVANLFDGLLIVDLFGKIRFANPAAGKLFNHQPEELIGEEFELPIVATNTLEVEIVRFTQEVAVAEMCVVPTQWEGESVYVVSLRDITERKRAEEALRESEERFRQMAENITDVFWLISPNYSQVFYVSPAYEKIWGRSGDKLYANPQSWIEAIHPEDREIVIAFVAQHIQGKSTCVEYRIVQPSGCIRWVWDRAFPIKNEFGEVYRTVGIAEDITERKIAEAQIKASLHEKEILLKEIHHRVKNNMQVISSLLELQSQSLDDRYTISLFKDSQTRIHSMALIHEQLYQSEHLDAINFAEYIQQLVVNLFQSFSPPNNIIHIEIKVERVFLNLETAIPCGLIINELVSNSLKYAFPEQYNGQISIEFRQLNSQQFYLSVSDNGIGFPASFDVEKTETLGLRLVRMLTRQLKGILEINKHQNTQFELTFYKLNYRRRF